MNNQKQLQRLTKEHGYEFNAILAQAKAEAVAQHWKMRGLTDYQSDVVMWIEHRGYPYCVKGQAIYHYLEINEARRK